MKAIVAHLRTELVLAEADTEHLRTAVHHFDEATERSLADSVPLNLHADPAVNGWLLHGARYLLTVGKTHRDRLREVIGRLAQAGAVAPHGRVGTALARVRRVGAGSYGTVWHAIRLDAAASVAVKQCHAQDGKPPDPRLVDALRKEAVCLMRLSHDSIPRFVACDFDRPDPYVAMQLVEGERLGDWLLQSPSLPDRERVLSGVLAALEHAHRLGIYHRDLKAENILVAAGPRPYVIDWGGAKTLLPEHQTAMPKFQANIRNSAPECISHVRSAPHEPFQYTSKQDLWSFGAIAYQVLSGHHPFDVPGDPLNTAERILRGTPAPLDPKLGPWGSLVTALLQKEPAKRPSSCGDLIASLNRAAVVGERLDDIVEQVVRDLGDYMVDADEVLIAAMADTNATGYGCDDYQILSAYYDAIEDAIHIEAELHFSGDQDDERMWCGDAFRVRIQGTATSQWDAEEGEKWKVDEYHIDECVGDQPLDS